MEKFLIRVYNTDIMCRLSLKRYITTFLLLIFASNFSYVPVLADVFKGHAEMNKNKEFLDKELFTGTVDELDSDDIIQMSVSQVLDGSFSLEGDEFFAEVTSDVVGDKGVILPKGTLAHGIIKQTSEAKRLGRDGYVDLSFDYLVTPDGREIMIEGKMSTRMHPIKSAAKIVATDVGYTAVGGVLGGMTAMNLLGIEAAIASQGYTVAGGAAIGGAIGLGMSLYRKGKDVLIAPGDEIRVKIKSNVSLPVYRKEALVQKEIKYPGLDVRITNILIEKDPFGVVNTLTLSMSISNMTKMNFSTFDMALVNDKGNIYHPSVFGDTRLMYTTIKSGDRIAGRISFAVDNVKDRFWLTFYQKGGKKEIAKLSLDNAYEKVSPKVKKRNAKMKVTPNYYKDRDVMHMFDY